MTTEEQLIARAKARHPRCHNWWGTRGGGTAKHAQCYVCDIVIDTWSAQYAIPRHAAVAIGEHYLMHLAEPVGQ